MALVAEPQRTERPRVRWQALGLLAGVAVVALFLDQFTKHLVVSSMQVGETVPVLGPVLQFRYVLNPGAAFSLGTGTTWIFSIVAAAVAIFIVVFARRIRSIAWAVVFGLLLGGNLGNLTDRLFREPSFGQGHVVDFFQLIYFPAIFNVADVWITSAMVLFVLLTLRGVHLDGTRDVRAPKQATGDEGPQPSGAADSGREG